MKNRKTPLKALILKALSVVMAALLLVSVLASCGGDSNEGSDASNEQSYGETTTYTVSVKTAGGMVMAELDVYVYADSTLADMKNYAKTNAEGIATFSLPKNDNYAIVVSGAPKGFKVNASYGFVGESAAIVLESSLITDGELFESDMFSEEESIRLELVSAELIAVVIVLTCVAFPVPNTVSTPNPA